MGLNDITNKIVADAQEQADEIGISSEKETKRIMREKEKAADRMIDDKRDQARLKESRLKDQCAFQMRMISKNASLRARQEVMDDVFGQATRKVSTLNEDEFAELYAKMLRITPQIRDGVVRTTPARREAASKALKAANSDYRLSDEALESGTEGLVISSDAYEIDLSADNIVASAREGMYPEVYKILFK